MSNKRDETETASGDESMDARPKRSARARVMDLLARRNYSALELKKKLKDDYDQDELDAALEFARESKWLLPEKELSERVASTLGRKRKGHRFINQYLKAKGLPPVARNSDEEFDKARAIVQSKLKRSPNGEEDRGKIQRLLINRGYDSDTIRRVLESFRANA